MPKVVDLTNENSYTPFENQRIAHAAREKHILYGGAVGGGKSCWVVNDALWTALGRAGCVVGVFRWELSNFKTTTFAELDRWVLSVPNLVLKHNQQDHWIKIFNGSMIRYGGLKPAESAAGDPYAKIKSLALSRGYLDEVSDVPEKMYDFFITRTRRIKGRNIKTGKDEFPPDRIGCASNPSMGWVKSRWIDQKRRGYKFVQSRARDNIHLDAGYEAGLREAWKDTPAWIDQFLEGDWGAVVDFEAIYPADKLADAVLRDVVSVGEVEFGVDVATFGDDKTVVVMRRGMQAEVILERSKQSTTDTTKQVAMLADQYNPQVIRVDSIGEGRGVYDQLNEMRYPVEEFIGGARPNDKRFLNKRAEAFWGVRNLLVAGSISLPNHSTLVNEMGTIHYLQTESDRVIRVESKKALKKRLGHSPDFADALVYAFSGQGFQWMSAKAY